MLGRRARHITMAAGALVAALCPGDGPASRRACAETLADSLATLPPVLAALGGDLITFAATTAEVRVATLVAASPADVQAVLRTPAAYRQAIPALERADVIARRARAGGGEDLLVDWELEIPLFNLKGKMWVGGDGQRVVLDLFEGNFAPGQLVFTWDLGSRPGQTVLALKAAVSNQAGGWLIRSVAARSRFAGPAINAAAAYVAVRATAALAEHPRDPGARRPQAAPAPPPLAVLNGHALAERLLGAEGIGASCLGLVKRAPSGRLALVEIAAPTRRPAREASAALAALESWRAFPGWKHVDRLPPARASDRGQRPWRGLRLGRRRFRHAARAHHRRCAVDVPQAGSAGVCAAQVHRRRAAAGARPGAGPGLRRRAVGKRGDRRHGPARRRSKATVAGEEISRQRNAQHTHLAAGGGGSRVAEVSARPGLAGVGGDANQARAAVTLKRTPRKRTAGAPEHALGATREFLVGIAALLVRAVL